jgi:hypothetical protein
MRPKTATGARQKNWTQQPWKKENDKRKSSKSVDVVAAHLRGATSNFLHEHHYQKARRG